MANKNFTLTGQTLNDSVSVGDVAYYATITNANGFDQLSAVTKIGDIEVINRTTSVITIDTAITSSPNLVNKFMFFSKDNAVNSSGLTGYYAEVKMKNTSLTESELFSVSSETSIGSK
tara:strand:+ start:1358 stop:1711 length:354 start_codon:yes stop_codon:yes gene_type:complete